MSDAGISLVVLGLVVVLFVWNRLPVEIVAIGSALLLAAFGVITFNQAIEGFGDPTVLLIAGLFVVSEGLDSTGVTAWIGDRVLEKAGTNKSRILVITMLLSAGLTALISLNGAVAALLPMVVILAVRAKQPASQLLMPLAFAGSAGSLLVLTGSPVNVIISQSAANYAGGAFGYFEFLAVGLPMVVGAILMGVFLGPHVLPKRSSKAAPADLSRHAHTLIKQYEMNTHVYRLRVREQSPLVGRERFSWDITPYHDLAVVTVLSGSTGQPVDSGPIEVGDRLSVTGDVDDVNEFLIDNALILDTVVDPDELPSKLLNKQVGVAEVVVAPRSRLVGETVGPGRLLESGSLVVLAVQRQGKDRGAHETTLQVGDVMLVEGEWDSIEEGIADPGLLVVDSPDLVKRQAVPLGARSGRAIIILGAMIVLLATGVIPTAAAALLAAGAMIVSRVLTLQQAYRRIQWTTVILIGGIIPLSTAIRQSGAGEELARIIVNAVDGAGPTMLLVALFLLTMVFSQLISNTATALIMIPIALSAAQQLDVSPRPVLMSLCVAAAAAFLTPVATPANMMVMGPAGYKFNDYWKLGLPMLALSFVISVFLVPVVWHF